MGGDAGESSQRKLRTEMEAELKRRSGSPSEMSTGERPTRLFPYTGTTSVVVNRIN